MFIIGFIFILFILFPICSNSQSRLIENGILWGMSYKEAKNLIPYKTNKLKIPGAPWLVYEQNFKGWRTITYLKFTTEDELYEIEFSFMPQVVSENQYADLFFELHNELIDGLTSSEYRHRQDWIHEPNDLPIDYGEALKQGLVTLSTHIPSSGAILQVKKENYIRFSLVVSPFNKLIN